MKCFFGWHKWKLTDKEVVDAPLDRMAKRGEGRLNIENDSLSIIFSQKTVIHTFQCERCTKVDIRTHKA